MEQEYVYICVSHKENPCDILVYMCNKDGWTPGIIVTKLLEHDLAGIDWLPYVVTSFDMISNLNVLKITDNRAEFFNDIHDLAIKQ